jgi:SAM-dependent methyltransferase
LSCTDPAPRLDGSAVDWEAGVRSRGGTRTRFGWTSYDDISEDLARSGVKVVPHRVDVEAYRKYVADSGYLDMEYFDRGRRPCAAEKYLEHYVSIDLLRIRPEDVVIDVASASSPFPDIVRKRGVRTAYRQDIWYEPGIHGDRIGSEATRLPLPDASADALTLHCSFEHFEGNRDGLFVREAARVLRPGGRLCILPLYTNRTYCIQTDPDTWAQRPVQFEPDALVCIAAKWEEPHGRFYDVRHFLDRIVANLGELDLRIHRIENATEAAPDCYLRLAALFTKPAGPTAGGSRP